MQLVLFGLGLIAFICAWRFAFKPTLLDYHRDQLFDLRDEVREFFHKRDELGSAHYIELRDLLNGYLRFTEALNIWKMAYFEAAIENDKELSASFQEKWRKHFQTNDAELAKFIRSIRIRSYWVGVGYMTNTSIFALALSLAIAPFIILFHMILNMWAPIKSGILAHVDTLSSNVSPLRGTVSMSRFALTQKIMPRRLAEECSLNFAKTKRPLRSNIFAIN